MPISNKITIISTGASEATNVSPDEILTLVAVGDAADYTANVEVKLTELGNWVVAETGLADSTPKTTTGGVTEIRLNVSDMGTATTIDFEVSGANL